MKISISVCLFLILQHVQAASIIMCGNNASHIRGEYPTAKCGQELGWENYYTPSSNAAFPGVWMRSSISSSEYNKFTNCCRGHTKYVLHESGISETAYKSVARLSNLSGEAEVFVGSIISGLIVAAIAA